jgi:FkbH-like protein
LDLKSIFQIELGVLPMNLFHADSPAHPSSLIDLLCQRSIFQPSRPAYTFLADGERKESKITYKELDRRARIIGVELQHRFVPSERVLLLYSAGLDYVTAFFGCLYAGIIAVPTYPPRNNRSLPRLQSIVADARASAVLTTKQVSARLAGSLVEVPDMEKVPWITTDDLEPGQEDNWQKPLRNWQDIAFLQYTSGSTGEPRGVMVSHENLIHNLAMMSKRWELGSDDVGVSWLPIFHDMGLIAGVLLPLYQGFPTVLMAPTTFLQRPLRWLQAITHYHGTISCAPNFAYELCMRKVSQEECKELHLDSWRVVVNGAEPVRPETLTRFTDHFSPCGFRPTSFVPGYGLAEATLMVSSSRPGQHPSVYAVDKSALERGKVRRDVAGEGEGQRLYVSCGSGADDQKILIVDPVSQRRCSDDEVGEIWLAGPSIAQGYWGRPGETRQAFGVFVADSLDGPYFRTGDLGFLKDNELYICGRLKDVIIIRGRNHYPQDIEKTMDLCHPRVRPGCGTAFSIDAAGEERLVLAQEVERGCRPEETVHVIAAIRRAVSEQHELQVYAVVLLKPGSLPKTSSGKVQRSACRAAFLADSLEVVERSILELDVTASSGYAEALTPELLLSLETNERLPLLYAYVQNLVGDLLHIPTSQLDMQQSLSALGLDSLLTFEFMSRIESDLGIHLTIGALLEEASLARLAERLSAQLQAYASPPCAAEAYQEHRLQPLLPRQERRQDGPLSFEQERLWLLDQLEPGNPAYNIPLAVHLRGSLKAALLENGLNEIISRHETLRTIFLSPQGLPVQHVLPALTLKLLLVDLSEWADGDRLQRAQQLAAEEALKPFDLANGPLFRVHLFRLSADDHVLLFVAHHIICDVDSLGILLRELIALYEAQSQRAISSLPELPLQYTDFVAWQRETLHGKAMEADFAYWKAQLDALHSSEQERHIGQTRGDAQNFQGGHAFFNIPGDLVESLQEMSRRENVTLFMILLAAFDVVLHAHSKQRNLLVGTPFSGRIQPETRNLIGLFAYPLVLRTDLEGDPAFRSLLAHVREIAVGAYTHYALPFAKVVEIARLRKSTVYNPLFQVMFSLVKSPLDAITASGLTLDLVDVEARATDIDLFLTAIRTAQGLRVSLKYNLAYFPADTIDLIMEAYIKILEQCVQQPEVRLSYLCSTLPEGLKSQEEASSELTLTIAATFTAEPVDAFLAFWMRQLSIPATIRHASYSQVFQQLLDASSLLRSNHQGINIVLVRLEDWLVLGDGVQDDGSAHADSELTRNVGDFIEAITAAAGSAVTPYLVCICPSSSAAIADARRARLLKSQEERIVSALKPSDNIYTITPSELAALYPVSTYEDPYTDRLGHIPFTQHFFAALGTMLARWIFALKKPPYKVIVLDCDQTLWRGVCGEVGARGIEIDAPRKALQEFMVAQQERGMLLCLCSKNNERDIVEVFELHSDMPLRREHIVAWRINWRPKSENIHSLANTLQLGLDSFIFIDDNLLECAEVRTHCPGVLALCLPQDVESIPTFLQHVWIFDHFKTTSEDRQRTAFYQQNAQRESLRREALTFEDFLQGLNLEIYISPLEVQSLNRIAQLMLRTNQFNCSSLRRSESQLRDCLAHGSEVLAVSVRDRFGDYGVVGAMVCESQTTSLYVDTFLLSCRALGRGVEHQMLARLGSIAMARGLRYIDILYVHTKKNSPARDFLEHTCGASATRLPHQRGYLYRFQAELASTCTYHSAHDSELTGNAAGKPDSDGIEAVTQKQGLQQRIGATIIEEIATELSDIDAILQRISAQGESSAERASKANYTQSDDASVSYVPPQTATEKRLCAIWQELLNREQIGVHDNFFSVGGHSLLAIQLLSRVRTHFQVELPLKTLFDEDATIARLAQLIELAQIEQADMQEIEQALDELATLSDEEVAALLASESQETDSEK